MTTRVVLCIVALLAVLTGCATSRTVTVGQLAPARQMKSAALVAQDGNSPEMDSIVQQQLRAYGITPKLALPVATRQSKDVDLIVGYTDFWYWDIVMYLRAIKIDLFEGESGNLLVTGRWENSAFHGYQDPQDVVKELLDDMFAKLAASK